MMGQRQLISKAVFSLTLHRNPVHLKLSRLFHEGRKSGFNRVARQSFTRLADSNFISSCFMLPRRRQKKIFYQRHGGGRRDIVLGVHGRRLAKVCPFHSNRSSHSISSGAPIPLSLKSNTRHTLTKSTNGLLPSL